jgi:hypothetical protein
MDFINNARQQYGDQIKKKKKHHQGQILFAAFHHGIEMPHSSSPG